MNLIRHEEPRSLGEPKSPSRPRWSSLLALRFLAERAVTAILLERRVHMMQKRVEGH